MKYFKFTIPEGLAYSPNWCGTMSNVPKNLNVMLYNEKDHYGVASTTDDDLPAEVEEIAEEQAFKIMSNMEARKDQSKLFYGKTLYKKWEVYTCANCGLQFNKEEELANHQDWEARQALAEEERIANLPTDHDPFVNALEEAIDIVMGK